MEVPPELFFYLVVVLHLSLFDLVEEGFNVLLVDVALLLDVQEVVDGVDHLIVVRIQGGVLLVVLVIKGFCEVSEEEFLVPTHGKVRLEDCLQGLAVLMGGDRLLEGVDCDERIHVCGLHSGL